MLRKCLNLIETGLVSAVDYKVRQEAETLVGDGQETG